MVVAAEQVAAFSFVRRPPHPALVFGSLKLMSALGQKQTCAVTSRCPLSANSGHSGVYSITSIPQSAGLEPPHMNWHVPPSRL